MESGIENLFIGTCSWKYDSWIGLVYSPQVGRDHLREYARHYRTVEIDQWFWSLHGVDKISLPQPEVVRQYQQAVPPGFMFTVKVPNSITLTHFYRKGSGAPLQENPHFLSVPLFNDFLERLSPMHDRIGTLMFQFEYLNKQKMASQQELMRRLATFFAEAPRPVPLAVELRNPNYLNSRFFEFLSRSGVYPVFLQGYYLPPVSTVFDSYRPFMQNLAVVRLHGPERDKIEALAQDRWDRLLVPRDGELDQVADLVAEMLRQKTRVFLNVNNHFEGSAPLTIERIRSRLDDRFSFDRTADLP